jgi:TRAP-type C4-dicarboxylate transport system substrate-binding protein
VRALAFAVVAALAVLPGCGGSAKGRSGTHRTVLKLEASVGTTEAVRVWAHAAEKRSGGTLRIDTEVSPLAHGKTPDVEPHVMQMVRSGAVPLAAVGARSFDLVGVHSFQPLVAPFLIDSYDLQQRVLASALVPRMLAGTKPIGLVGLAILPGPERRMLGIARTFREPRDFRGSAVGMQEGGVAVATIRALGGRPHTEPQEVHPVGVDAYEQQLGATAGNEFYLDAHYMTTDLAPWPRPLVVVANQGVYRRLSRAQREALASASHMALDAAMKTVRDEDRQGVATLCSAPVAKYFSLIASSPAQRSAMRRAVAPVYALVERDRNVAELIRRIEAMRPAAKPDPPVSCPAVGRGGRGRARTSIDGVYVMDTSAADVPAEQRVSDPTSVAPENLGHWVLVFDRGRFANTQRYKNACTWAYGKYTVAGHTMRWIVTAGGGIAPNNTVNKPGQDFKFTWSRFRDTVTVGPVKGATSPDNFDRRPWHRISARPSAAPLDDRCPPPARWDSQ